MKKVIDGITVRQIMSPTIRHLTLIKHPIKMSIKPMMNANHIGHPVGGDNMNVFRIMFRLTVKG